MLAIDATSGQVIACADRLRQPHRAWLAASPCARQRRAGCSGRRQPGGQRRELGFRDPCGYQF